MSLWRDYTLQHCLDIVATLAVITMCGALGWNLIEERLHATKSHAPAVASMKAMRVSQEVSTTPISLSQAAFMGADSAKAAIMEYSDFECPFCGTFARDIFPQVRETIIKPGKALFAFRHLPLRAQHADAFRASEESECARRQSKFWEAHDLLFRNQRMLHDLDPSTAARDLGLDDAQFRACMSSGATAAAVQRDVDTARSLSVSGTPAFFVGTLTGQYMFIPKIRLVGIQSAQQLDAAVNDVLAATGPH
jgi:protein-disulfide isomerase